ncbi:hypothetical protein AJ80_08470 [Polytolypa hystricis UAMH7299]|uniref:Dimethylaniline monooxygenase [N-oxide-forming] 5 n=1 Tax=Polytolypa hystricis (strain UAMH7299) TaxID=1447883 RepID=A0A2B7X788_POLH7|nr:hypothetical protein AJ80_08470 [Polytolypa hystricis UAMH7299]
MSQKGTIAVVGCGVSGLAALKNFREEGFDAVAFDRRSYVGGLWRFSDGLETTVLSTTISNVSRYKNVFTDFPYHRADSGPHLTASEVHEYLQAYAKHFGLLDHIRLGSLVSKVKRDRSNKSWELHLVGKDSTEEIVEFDKVAICTGPFSKPYIPSFQGRELYSGRFIHSQAFKNPEEFRGLRVMVIGMGNTATDTATSLVGIANTIHLSHRGGANIFPRICRNKPADLNVNRRTSVIKGAVEAVSPPLSRTMRNRYVQQLTKEHFELDPSWRLHPPPSIVTTPPVVSDSLIGALQTGAILSAHGLARFRGPLEVELDDGTCLLVDAVICCTGYRPDLHLIQDEDPVEKAMSKWGSSAAESNNRPLPRLYQNIFPPDSAMSIAYLNIPAFTTGTLLISDLTAMAVAQIWSGASSLPSQPVMEEEIDRHHAWVRSLKSNGTMYWSIIHEASWWRWVNDIAGTGVNEKLGYGFSGWRFWMSEPKFCNLLMTGVDSPHVYRLFDGRRKRWPGAHQAIIGVNREVKERYGL